MFEFESTETDARRQHLASHADLHSGPNRFHASSAARLSLLAWSEHCVECAIPHCYTSCDLYRSRRDGKCRRFTYGIYRNREVRSWLPYGAEIEFRVISHLWTKGNARTVPLWLYRIADTINLGLGWLANVASTLVSPFAPKRKVTRGFYHFRKVFLSWLHRVGGRLADGFLLQTVNPHHERLSLRLVIAPDPRPRGAPVFEQRLDLAPGFSEFWIPTASITRIVELGRPFEISLQLGNIEPRLLYLLCADFVSGVIGPVVQREGAGASEVSGPARLPENRRIKAIVWDLDNTLWDGVFVESADGGPPLRPGVKDLIRMMDERGILQSVASKNTYEEVWPHLERLGIAEYFLHPRINWERKSGNVADIIDVLNIGSEAVAFIDDQPFERGEVHAVLPAVLCLPDTILPTLSADPRFSGDTTAEARHRRQYYRNEARRIEARTPESGDYTEYLRSCRMVLQVRTPRASERDRVHELIQRTNQLNFSGNRYTREQLDELLAETTCDTYVLQCQDRFGDFGLVGFSLIRPSGTAVRMVDLALSCRVQSKHVEHAFLGALLRHYQAQGYESFLAEFRRTPRNAPAGKVFEEMGFEPLPPENAVELYRWPLATAPPSLDYIEVAFERTPTGSVAS